MISSRIIFVSLLAGFSNLAFAEVCSKITDDGERLACFDEARACVTIQSDSGRLDCFDKAFSDTDSLHARTETGDAPVQTSDINTNSEAAAQSSGPERSASKGGFEATIVDVTTNSLKLDYLWLDNGQIWRENENSRVRFKAGQKVTIEDGILGSFNLTVGNSKKVIKVKRVR